MIDDELFILGVVAEVLSTNNIKWRRHIIITVYLKLCSLFVRNELSEKKK